MDYRHSKDVLNKSYILRCLDAGTLPSVRVVGNNPIHLQKDESVIWNFAQTTLFEIKKHVRYVGGSRGISMRIARGVYYHVGSHRGHRIDTEHFEKTAVGDLAICSKNIYFISAVRAVRIPCVKVVSVNLYRDGIEIFKDPANSKPLVFRMDDPHFAANLLTRLT